jgi:hypothetical protein
MSRPTKLGGAGKMFSLMLRKRQHQILLNKSEELTRLTNKQVSVADIVRLCIDIHMEKTCDEIERRFRAQTY